MPPKPLPSKKKWRQYRKKHNLPKAPKPKCIVIDFYSRKNHP